ncbi:ABC transporter permease [Sphingomonas sp.]|uniref:ABC transporter permease n=1 Tax=Sphingomonas sp. TaxID=28214 RepID=UPI0028A7591B|nr:ABC transporter permease [Sphingomonas sp.]
MSAFGHALRAELRHLARDRWDLAGLTLIPALLLFLIGTMFWQGSMRRLPIVVVDDDRSSASRTILRAIDAAPLVHIIAMRATEAEAVEEVRRGHANGFVHLPRNLGAGLARHRTPVIRILYNASFLSSGSQAASGAASAVQAAAASLVVNQLSGHALPPDPTRRFAVEAVPLNNPASSFEWFLSTLIYPAVLHLIAAVTSAMALGRDLEGRSLGAWVARNGAIVPALFGKLLPYVAAASLWGVAWLLFVTLGRGWRVEGSIAAIVAGQTLFYLGTAAISALLVAATRETATALSVCAVYAGSALAYAGATLPLNGGSGFARFWSQVLPLTHYLALQTGQLGGQDLATIVPPMLALLAYVLVPGVLAWVLIRRQAR